MVPILLVFLNSRVASTHVKVKINNDTQKENMIFIKSKSCLTEHKIQEHEFTNIYFVTGFSKIFIF